MEQAYSLAAGCLKCPRRVRERNHIVHGYGDPTARVMFVGTAPDSEGANQTGVPWTRSLAGQQMQVILQALRLRTASDPTDEQPRIIGAYLTQMVRCGTHADDEPTDVDIGNCAAYLWHEIQLIKPRIIVPVGVAPTRLLCAKLMHTLPGDVAQLHGQTFRVGESLLVPMIDPTVITRGQAHAFARVLAALLEDQ